MQAVIEETDIMSWRIFKISIQHCIILFILLYAGVIIGLLGGSCLGQQSSLILAVPGQSIEEDIVLGAEPSNQISITIAPLNPNWAISQNSNPNIQIGTLEVRSSLLNWRIIVSANTYMGQMTEYDPSTFYYMDSGRTLENPMKVRAQAQGGYEVDLSKGGALIDGHGDMTIPIEFEQIVSPYDRPLYSDNIYHIEVSFIAAVEAF